jgi:ADP-ribose pyrophosphatase YjhB (NUDIX family)/mannose-6-phosphate isomerase-like protein (cupin superfamily)
VIEKLKAEFPGKVVIPNSETGPTEIICEVDPSSMHPDYSVAIAYVKESTPHRHAKSTEFYEVEEGKLDLYLDGVKHVLTEGQTCSVSPGVIHWAEGNWARVKVTSKPGWTIDDHIYVERAVSAGGVVVKKGRILFVKLTNCEKITFPKGHVEKDETYEKTALREVGEETGFKDLEIVKNLGMVTRPSVEVDGRLVIKDIHLFLIKVNSDSKGKSDEETLWLTKEEAMPRLFSQEAEFLKTVRNLEFPASTSASSVS